MPAPKEGHPRQCRAKSQVTRRRCRRWALVGKLYCQFHGGRRGATNRTGRFKLPSFYSKYLGPKLSERVAELLTRPHSEQVSLYEELAVARATACEALKLSQPLFDEEQSSQLKSETKALMMQTLAQAMSSVKDLVVAAAKIEKDSDTTVSIKVMNLVVQQIVIAINDVCGTDNLALAEAIAKAIDERVRLPLNERMNPTIQLRITESADNT